MRNTSLQQIIQKHKQSLIKGVATGLVATMCATGLVSCDDVVFTPQSSTTNNSELNTEHVTEGNTTNPNQPNNPTYTVEHSNTYLRTKDIWQNYWNLSNGIPYDMSAKQEFQMKAAPFEFLANQGVVYYDNNMVYAYGNEDFFNNDCIISRAFIDKNTSDCDLYLLVQYKSAPVSPLYSNNNNAYVATWMLKYTLDKDVYKDALLLSGKDYRMGLLIQQIDAEYEPQILSKTVVKYNLINSLDICDKNEVVQIHTDEEVNYISNIDYDNLSITVNYSTPSEVGKIYSYDVKLKETATWDKVLEGDMYTAPISQAERDSLTIKNLMPTYITLLGDGLYNFCVKGWSCTPTDEQKSTATLQYDLHAITINGQGRADEIDKYDNGTIPYSRVNDLTAGYESSKEYNK